MLPTPSSAPNAADAFLGALLSSFLSGLSSRASLAPHIHRALPLNLQLLHSVYDAHSTLRTPLHSLRTLLHSLRTLLHSLRTLLHRPIQFHGSKHADGVDKYLEPELATLICEEVAIALGVSADCP